MILLSKLELLGDVPRVPEGPHTPDVKLLEMKSIKKTVLRTPSGH